MFSADGINRHCLPNKETIARIIFASSKLPVTLYFNYDDGRLMRMFKQDEPEYVKSVIDIHYLRDMEERRAVFDGDQPPEDAGDVVVQPRCMAYAWQVGQTPDAQCVF